MMKPVTPEQIKLGEMAEYLEARRSVRTVWAFDEDDPATQARMTMEAGKLGLAARLIREVIG